MPGMKWPAIILLVCFLAGALGCGCGDDDDDSSSAPADDDTGSNDDDDADDDVGDDDTFPDDDADDDTDDDDDNVGEVHSALSARTSVLDGQGVSSCTLIGQRDCIFGTTLECAIFDGNTGTFAADPPEFLERIFYEERYLDLYERSENSGLTYSTTTPMPPGTPEETWADPAIFDEYRDHGDGAFYMGMQLSAAALRYAATGTDGDYWRMIALLEKQLLNWRVTGVPGAMYRSIFAMLDDGVSVPEGHPEYNLHKYKTRSNHVLYTVDETFRDLLPDYYFDGADLDGDTVPDVNTTPTAEGSPSLDAYSAAFLGQQLAYDLIQQTEGALRTEIGQNVSCFVTRLKKIRIAHLADSVIGQAALQYLTGAGAFHPDPDDIDLTQVDTMIGYVAEAIPPGPPGNFNFDCPDDPPFDVDPEYDLDANDPLFLVKFADVAYRLTGQGNHPIDFIYFVTHRGGDVGFLFNYAVFAYHTTRNEAFLRFIEESLIDEARGLEVLNTAGSFYLPPYCGDWIGGDLSHPIFYGTLLHLDDSPLAQEHRRMLREEFKDKLMANDGNAYLGMTYSAVMTGADDPDVDTFAAWAEEELEGYVLNPDYPLDPKRDYSTLYLDNPLPPPYDPQGPTDAEIAACEQGVELFGIEIVPGPGVNPEFEMISGAPLPVGMRVPHDLIWHFSPFNLQRDRGANAGRAHMSFADLTLPYWIGRVAGRITEGDGMALAWKDTGETCGSDRF
ncbi:MAG: hypothetical protein M5R36_07710 [Deltaproteobacteria bacterium]|nr:hypothetical protein [Deltaproteobacteria bacterium]